MQKSEKESGLISAEETKKNIRYLKAGAAIAVLVSGCATTVLGAAVATRALTPVVEEVIGFCKPSRDLGVLDNLPVASISLACPPVDFIRLRNEVASTYKDKLKFAEYIGVCHSWNLVMSKILWEHIRLTGGRSWNGNMRVTEKHVRRKMASHELSEFMVFHRFDGDIGLERIQQAQP